ncbi:MAG TPA: hydroxymethylbilane synthase [Candidatus Limnocylindria bacterium]|nr:hydroxymethylbilane synthase [Candidatus Limnocylindria bacterium]
MRAGTRGSRLALAQTQMALAALDDVELVVIRTRGDDSDAPLRELGEGIFVRALEDALRRGDIDVAVHSLKDLPTEEPGDLVVAAIPRRADPRDVVIARGRGGLAALHSGAVVGTGSVRREAFLRAARPDLVMRPVRGNVDTRLAKVERGEYDAVVLALAGLVRLGVQVAEQEILPIDMCPPAPGQGALAIQCRREDDQTRTRLSALDDPGTRDGVAAERALLRALGASCEIALGAHGRREGREIALDAALAMPDGVRRVSVRAADPAAAAARAHDALAGTVASA